MRIQYLDNLKGFAISLVIIGHICSEGIWSSLIYSFHMALFFFLSGIVGNCRSDFSGFMLKKARSLLLPFVTFMLLHSFLFKHNLWSIMSDNVKDGLWFIFVLFIIQIIDYLIFNRFHRDKIFYIITSMIVVLLLILLKKFVPSELSCVLSLSYIATNYPFYMLGRFLKEFRSTNLYLFDFTVCFKYKDIIQFVVVSAYFIVWSLSFYYGVSNEMSSMFLRFAATISLVILFKHFEYSKVNRLFTYLGKETLALYLLHYFFIRDIKNSLEWIISLPPFIQLISYGSLAVIVAIACVFVTKALKSNQYLGFLLFGTKLNL